MPAAIMVALIIEYIQLLPSTVYFKSTARNRNSKYRCDNYSSSNRSNDCHAFLEIACGGTTGGHIGFLLLKFTDIRHDRLLLGGSLQPEVGRVFLVS
jgi:hypothetical protein